MWVQFVCVTTFTTDTLSRMNEIALKRFDVPKLSHVVCKIISQHYIQLLQQNMLYRMIHPK